MLASVKIVSPLVRLRRARLMPVPGKVMVHVGDRVAPDEVIAMTILQPEHQLIDVAALLDVPRARAQEVIRCKAGQVVNEGDVLAGPVGLLRDTVRAPRRSRVVLVGDGKVLLQLETPPFELRAGYAGEVTEVIDRYGAVIEATGGLVQGAWGNDRLAHGLLHVAADRLDHQLDVSHLDVSLRGQIVFGGHCHRPEVLEMAQEIGLKGLILGSVSAALLPQLQRMPMAVLVLEGFGALPIGASAFKVLKSVHEREVVVRAARPDRWQGERPEVFFPAVGQAAEPPSGVEYWRSGLDVQVIGGPYAAREGTVTALLPSVPAPPSGVRAPAARVHLGEQEVAIPLTNLQVIA